MRIPNPRLIRLGGITKGAIVEKGDGELIVSPLIQPVIDLVSPTARVFPTPAATLGTVAAPWEDSFTAFNHDVGQGVNAGGTTDLAIMARGMWRFWVMAGFAFVGTQAFTNFSGLAIVDPAGNEAALIEFPHVNNTWFHIARQFDFAFQADGFILRHRTGARVALDGFFSSVQVVAARLL